MTELGETLWAIADQLRRLRAKRWKYTPDTQERPDATGIPVDGGG